MSENISYHLIRDNGITGIHNVIAQSPEGDIYQADSKHPHWQAIVDGLHANDSSVFGLFDVQAGLVNRLTSLSDRVSFDGNNILFDGDVQSGPLADHLLRCLESGVQDYAPVVKFWEKVATNPDERSREQLFTWLRSHEFTITEDGDILGYKGVITDAEGKYLSSHSGTAFVDGVEIKGRIPNNIGTVVTMPRAKVQNDPGVACHYGLHVGDWSYASNFATVTLEVHVNPRDVVSIPRDESQRKMRCCRYKVVKVRDSRSTSPIDVGDSKWEGDVGYIVDDYDSDAYDDYDY